MEKAIKKFWPIFVLPTFGAFLIGFVIPFAMGLYLSLCDFTTLSDAVFVGFQNYVKAFSDASGEFIHALTTAAGVPCPMAMFSPAVRYEMPKARIIS